MVKNKDINKPENQRVRKSSRELMTLPASYRSYYPTRGNLMKHLALKKWRLKKKKQPVT